MTYDRLAAADREIHPCPRCDTLTLKPICKHCADRAAAQGQPHPNVTAWEDLV